MENNNTIEKLNHLISIANDGKCGYENAANDVEDVTLKQLFRQYSNERDTYVKDIRTEVQRLGGSASNEGDILGALHRTWMDIKSAVTSGDREEILKTCITGEESAEKTYQEILKENISSETKQVLTIQLSGIEAALNTLRSLISAVKM